VTLLAGRLRRRDADHGGDEWLVVCQESELPTLQEEPEVADGGVGGQQLSVEGRVLDLCWRQLFGEKS
jgi:hypothetical protein